MEYRQSIIDFKKEKADFKRRVNAVHSPTVCSMQSMYRKVPGWSSPLPHHVSGKALSQHTVSILILSYAETHCGFGQTISAAKSGPDA